MTPAAFVALHLRLTEDRSPALTGRWPINQRNTPAGNAWLRDLRRYRLAWSDLEHSGTDPAILLRDQLGYILPEQDVQPLSTLPDTPP